MLLEFSPRDHVVFVRGVWTAGKQMTLAPVHEDNRQELVRVIEGIDNLANASVFAGLGLREGEVDPEDRPSASIASAKKDSINDYILESFERRLNVRRTPGQLYLFTCWIYIFKRVITYIDIPIPPLRVTKVAEEFGCRLFRACGRGRDFSFENNVVGINRCEPALCT